MDKPHEESQLSAGRVVWVLHRVSSSRLVWVSFAIRTETYWCCASSFFPTIASNLTWHYDCAFKVKTVRLNSKGFSQRDWMLGYLDAWTWTLHMKVNRKQKKAAKAKAKQQPNVRTPAFFAVCSRIFDFKIYIMLRRPQVQNGQTSSTIHLLRL